MVDVAIAENNNIEKSIPEALNSLEGLKWIAHGKTVAVKVNDTWASERDKTAVTQPDTLRTVLRYIKKFNPREIVVTGGSGAGETDEIFKIAGLMDVVREEGVEFFDHNRPPFEKINLEYSPELDVSGPVKSVYVNSRILEYDSLIVVSQLKMHETATVTLSLKNIAMSFPAADYYGHPRGAHGGRHFFEDMHSFIAVMARKFPIDLAIIVGHPTMVATGPIGGFTAETGLTIASKDALAADVVGAKILGLNIQGVRHLWEAFRLGIGEGRLDRINFPNVSLDNAISIFTKKVYGKSLSF